MSGHLAIIGLGPGPADQITPQAADALARADWLLGYGPYLDRLNLAPHQRIIPTDNREEAARAAHALRLVAEEGRQVAMVTGGDPGVFAMAAAVLEQMEQGPPSWRTVDIQIIPGITAMLAVAARVGAPLGHDFCAISLSDNLKPWSVIENRLRAAATGGFVMAFYNPRSRARPHQLGQALALLRDLLPGTVPVIFGRAIGRPDESVIFTTLAAADPEQVDMSTCVLIGTAETRVLERPGLEPLVYTPRSIAGPV